MKILYLEWGSFCNEDMFTLLPEMGHQVIRIPFDINMSEEELGEALAQKLKQAGGDILFSFNYYPNASKCCNGLGLKYVAWVYDSPHIQAYSYTVLNPCNYIFLFDYAMYQELYSAGIRTVYYLPLGVNAKRMSALRNSEALRQKYACDVSFVGSLYSEEKHQLYEKFGAMNDYAKGYLEGLMQAQLQVQGYNFLQESLKPDVVAELQKAYPTNPNASTVMKPEAIYADYVLARQVTARERQEILRRISGKHQVDLYTHDKNWSMPGIRNRGVADYYNQMPYIFMNSKINLNITLRSIKTGIPLRAFDIMGCGGFLLTNYQEELLEYFEPDQDFVYYTDFEELEAKVDYYLRHEDERRHIAESGCRKVRSQHSLEQRWEQIFEIVTNNP